jgi:NADPH-dependent glutamate synthase beta subunit-like oxidoreductase
MIMCGADLVGICTATLTQGYDIARPMVEGVKRYMDSHGYKDLRAMRDLIVPEVKTATEVTLYTGYAEIKNPHLAAPCKAACPHHIPAQAYIRSVAKKDFRAAYDFIVSKNPLQTVCGYVCNHICEDACTQGLYGNPLKIKAIKQFVMEFGKKQGWKPDVAKANKRNKRVAVVGSGPAGLSCAYSLVQTGYDVTVFEREKELGGALRYAIPTFRLSHTVVNEQLDLLKSMGVAFKTGIAFGTDGGKGVTIDSLKSEGSEAVVLGIGAQNSTPLGIPGENSVGVVSALDFLREPDNKRVLGDVVVVGGGFTAIDSARAAMRRGAKSVYVAYRRTKDEMPAAKEEIDIAEAEGLSFIYLAAPVKVVSLSGIVG